MRTFVRTTADVLFFLACAGLYLTASFALALAMVITALVQQIRSRRLPILLWLTLALGGCASGRDDDGEAHADTTQKLDAEGMPNFGPKPDA